jgi:uncharacterized protein YidB (DUF937 family)
VASATQERGAGVVPSADGKVARALVDLLGERADDGELWFEALRKRFEANQLKDHFVSWMTRRPNLSVSPEDLQQVFGTDLVKRLVDETGLDESDVLERLAVVLPRVVRDVTPFGESDPKTVQLHLQGLRKRLRV